MSALVPLLNSNAVDEWDIYNGWMTQETLRKYTKPTYTKNDPSGGPGLDGKMM